MAKEIVKCPMRCVIKKINVAVGDQVKEEDVLCIIEAMKMETPVVAPVSGKIVEVNVKEGQSAKGGDPLFVIES